MTNGRHSFLKPLKYLERTCKNLNENLYKINITTHLNWDDNTTMFSIKGVTTNSELGGPGSIGIFLYRKCERAIKESNVSSSCL